jgi:hypothetical protein
LITLAKDILAFCIFQSLAKVIQKMTIDNKEANKLLFDGEQATQL